MSQITLLTILLLIISLTVYTVKSGSRVAVRPTDSDSSICGDHAFCDTLSSLISNSSSVFNSSDSDITFLPGTHRLEVRGIHQLIVDKVSNATWHSEAVQETLIVCDSPLAFVFMNIKVLHIQNLNFTNCGYQLPLKFQSIISFNSELEAPDISTAVGIASVDKLLLENVVIKNSHGYGLLVANTKNQMKILSCFFLENNKNCSHDLLTSTNKDSCIGGNVMILFNAQSPQNRSSRSVHVVINNTLVQGGSDNSQPVKITECHKYDSRASFPYRANGLALISLQHTHQILVEITHINFSENIGKKLHPAVLIHDNSSYTNQYTIAHCLFVNEGPFRVNSVTEIAKKHVASTSHVQQVTIINSTFSHGSNPHSLLLCLYPGFQKYIITIHSCIFENFLSNTRLDSLLKISYGENIQPSLCPNTRTIVNSSTFRNTKGRAAEYILPTFSSYGLNLTKPCLLILVNNCTYEHNAHVTTKPTGIVMVAASPMHKKILPGQYPDGMNSKGISMEQMGFTNTVFKSNSVGSLKVQRSLITLENCEFHNSTGTALIVGSSVVVMKEFNKFTNNTGQRGGGIDLNESVMHFTSNSVTLIAQNYAHFGGGIFGTSILADKKHLRKRLCSLDFGENSKNITISLKQNKAKYAGNSIFAAFYEKCFRAKNCVQAKCDYIEQSFKENYFLINWNNSKEISSRPKKLCLCSNGQTTSKCSYTRVSVFPGQTFNISLAAIGQFDLTIETVVKSTVCSFNERSSGCSPDYYGDLGIGESVQTLLPCETISYTVNSLKNKTRIKVEIDQNNEAGIRKSIKIHPFDILVQLNPCPLGFILTKVNVHSCECSNYLKKRKIECDEHFGRIIIEGIRWVGFHSKNIFVHNSCPFDYCLTGVKYISLNQPDEQCNFNRSKILCGACRGNLSMVLGTSNCKKCSNVYLLLIIPFALAGVALVVLLLKCNLTVSVGHINGIIFYANIVQVNKALLFPNQQIAYQIFSTFIAWLNLDLSIETCFFENMDSYGKVWLQFVFPVYLWIMIGLIVLLANYSNRLSRMIGSNSVPVLATLFLLSYAKLLRTIIAAVSFTFVEFQDDSYLTVWLKDGNVEYFNTKHAALFLAAIIFATLYILPLTLLVLLAPCLQARSHHKAFKWVNRLKPFLDAYQGPYTDKFRYWTGLLLILRVLLFIIDAFNYESDPSMSFFWTITILGPFAMLCLIKGNVYRHKMANHLETLTLFNIVILCSVNWLTTTTGYGKWHPIREYATYISVAVTMTEFIVIVCYQVYVKVTPKSKKKVENIQEIDAIGENCETRVSEKSQATCSVVELEPLKEPLLDTE